MNPLGYSGPATQELVTLFLHAGYVPELADHLCSCQTCGQQVDQDGVPKIQWCAIGMKLVERARALPAEHDMQQRVRNILQGGDSP